MIPGKRHIAHILFRLDFGGLENGLINLINLLPSDRYDHSIIALTDATAFAERIERPDVRLYQMQKRPGKDPGAYRRLFSLLRELRPDVVHTRNLGALDCQLVARLAGVPVRVHGEHGWDVDDPHGTLRKNLYIRRAMRPLVHRWVAVSSEIERWLSSTVGVETDRIIRICNGVDVDRFRPGNGQRKGPLRFGTVTRFSEIKDPLNTLEAFIGLSRSVPHGTSVRLTMVGDGPLRQQAIARARDAGVLDMVHLPGSQIDVLPWLQDMDVFVLGSRREGISNTILEAMAAGLPVIATDTGGNSELIEHGVTGELVPIQDPRALGAAMGRYVMDPGRVCTEGAAARRRVEEKFSLVQMVSAYDSIYQHGNGRACAE